MAWDEYWNCVGTKIGQNADVVQWALRETAADVREYIREALQEFINWYKALEQDVKTLVGIGLASVAGGLLKTLIEALVKHLPKMAAALARNPYFLAGLAGAIAGVGIGMVILSADECWPQWDAPARAA